MILSNSKKKGQKVKNRYDEFDKKKILRWFY
jgi:hypothetical protein